MGTVIYLLIRLLSLLKIKCVCVLERMQSHQVRFSLSYSHLQNLSLAQETELLRYQRCSEKCNISVECYFEKGFLSILFKWQHVWINYMPDPRDYFLGDSSH